MINHLALSSESQIHERWQFAEEPPIPASYFSEAFDTYQLEARVLPTVWRDTECPQLLAIHGARSDYTKLNAILYPLQTLGIASLSGNLSGHSRASGIGLEETSLGNNMREALRYADHLAPHLKTVLGHSLGGALALKVAQAHHASVKKIVLFCPAIYPEAAYHRCFGGAFKEAISTPFGFLDSHSLRFLREFEGDLMLIIGQHDGLRATDFGRLAGQSVGRITLRNTLSKDRDIYSAIPFEVIDAIEQSITPKQFEKLVLPDCDHSISSWLRSHPSHAYWIANKIATFIGIT